MSNRLIAAFTLPFLLSACGGGGSDDNPPPPDTNPPSITLFGNATTYVEYQNTYSEPGALAVDDVDGEVDVSITGVVDTNQLGSYEIVYFAQDSSNNSSTVVRTVEVVDSTAPIVTLQGENPIDVAFGTDFSDLGATAMDNVDGPVEVTISGFVDTNQLGRYEVAYFAQDSRANSATVIRTINVVDREAPVLILQGNNPLEVALGSNFNDPGATVTDNADDMVEIAVNGSVDVNTVGSYEVSYSAIDASGNESSTTREVVVKDLEAPVINLNGESNIMLFVGDIYEEQGATALDNLDGDLTNEVVSSGIVDHTLAGTYYVEYSVYDTAGNFGEATREVIVVEKSYDITFRDSDLTLYENEYTHRFWFDFVEEQNTSRSLTFKVSAQSTADRFDFTLDRTFNPTMESSGYIELTIFDDTVFEGQEIISIEVLDEDQELVTLVDIKLEDESSQPIRHAPLKTDFLDTSSAVFDDILYVTDGQKVVKYDLTKEQNIAYAENIFTPYFFLGDSIAHNGEMYYFADGVLRRLNKELLTFEFVSSAPEALGGSSQIQVIENKIYMVGGFNEHGDITRSAYSYDLEAREWKTLASANVERYDSATAVIGDTLYVFGGNYSNFEYSSYNTQSDSWTSLGTYHPLNRDKHTAVTSGKYIYVLKTELYGYGYQEVMRYDTELDTWQIRYFDVLNYAYRDTFIYKGRIYLVGGDDGIEGSSRVDSVYWGDD
ncbi:MULTISPECIES: DUF5011 domain-containing protein [Vibrio]|uniref:DUF5011 domain-containing protein n=1 Tax=Vibrio TaxID=662 RepID=UPI0009BCA3FD|nr:MULTISPECIES: DUF5011 domain-containing protein [Vibrio]